MEEKRNQFRNSLVLKRYERPEEGYWDGFLREFHDRQSAVPIREQGLSGAWNRFTGGFGTVGSSKWLCAAAAIYALITCVFLTVFSFGGIGGQLAKRVESLAAPVPHGALVVEPAAGEAARILPTE